MKNSNIELRNKYRNDVKEVLDLGTDKVKMIELVLNLIEMAHLEGKIEAQDREIERFKELKKHD